MTNLTMLLPTGVRLAEAQPFVGPGTGNVYLPEVVGVLLNVDPSDAEGLLGVGYEFSGLAPLFGNGAPGSLTGQEGQSYFDRTSSYAEHVYDGGAWNATGSGGGSSTPSWLPPGAILFMDFVNGHYYAGGAVVDDPADLMISNSDYSPHPLGTISSEGWVSGLVESAAFVLPDAVALPLIASGITAVVIFTADNHLYAPEFVELPAFDPDRYPGVNAGTDFILGDDDGSVTVNGAFTAGSLSCYAVTLAISPTFSGSFNGRPVIQNANTNRYDFNLIGFDQGSGPLDAVKSITIYPPVPDEQLPLLSGAIFAAMPTTRTVQITSGASPVDVPLPTDDYWTTLLVEVTSGGTAGTEIVNIPNPALDGNGFNGALLGRTVNVVLKTQTDGSDVVKVSINTNDGISAYDNNGFGLGILQDGSGGKYAVLDYEDASMTFQWASYNWFAVLGNYNNDSVRINQRVPLPPGGTTGQVPVKSSGADGDVGWGGPIVSGDWTPTLSFGGSATDLVLTLTFGSYVQIGKAVICNFHMEVTTKGSSTGDAVIGGLPVSVASNLQQGGGIITQQSGFNAALTELIVGQMTQGPDGFALFKNNLGSTVVVTDADFVDGAVLSGNFTYFTS